MDKLEEYFKDNSIITNKQAESIGIKRHTLSNLAKKGKLERIKGGVYQKKGGIIDEFVLISCKNDRIIFSYQTALFLHDLSDRTPNVFHISVPQGYNASHIKKRYSNVNIHYVKKESFEIGVTTASTPLGNEVKVYDKERCICDIVLDEKNIDKQIFIDALHKYFSGKDKNMRRLIKYSRRFGIEESVRKYMEVLT